MQHRAELQAALHTIRLRSPDPLAMARFYSRAYGMSLEPLEGGYACRGPQRQVQIVGGPAHQLGFAEFALHDDAAWQAFRERARGLKTEAVPDVDGEAIGWRDPDGNLVVFSPPRQPGDAGLASSLPPATLQHFALRTPNLPDMLDFYTRQVGLVLSDAVRDPEGQLRACFLRSDHLHHALALFFAPVACFDHQSFEAPDWAAMKTWGDHMAGLREPIVWGLGRHGPGNDVFFMVRDPDGNLAEISAEIEHCESDRPAGEWPHEERTLNLWGKAILRS
ncbi:glyoxalase [Rhodoferax koreense]|uniref:Glyoxalase n=1 Tax=Rhodoferax koreensis TaxID=1842727 RepID=A0A1P8K0S9_9BURK|nr:VOC family protein [Rhodoferax koreense]APW39609.1 glyoxalase [Rhodoferax koreense]